MYLLTITTMLYVYVDEVRTRLGIGDMTQATRLRVDLIALTLIMVGALLACAAYAAYNPTYYRKVMSRRHAARTARYYRSLASR